MKIAVTALVSYASDVGFACYVPLALQMKKAKRQFFRREYYAGVITQCIVFSPKLTEPEFDRVAYPCIFAKGI